MKLKLYGQTGCKTCHDVKNILDERKIQYTYVNVFDFREQWDFLKKQNDIKYTPTLEIYYPKEKRFVYLAAGRDFDGPNNFTEKIKGYEFN